jgi:hypothetical protein
MTNDPPADVDQLERRIAALEGVVARLSALIEPTQAVSSIASPVALASLKESGQHQFHAKFFALLDLGESLIKYSAALAFAEAVDKKRAIATVVSETFMTPPTLGKIVSCLRDVINNDSGGEWPVDSIRDAFLRPGRKPKPTTTARYLFDEFIRVRNEERGHGAQLPEGYYEELYFKHNMTVHDCIKACGFVQLPLVHIHAVNNVDDQYEYQATLLMGVSPSATRIQTSAKVPVGAACVWDNGSRLMPLHNFIAYRYCPKCNSEHLFFAERMTSDRLYFHSYIGNHRLEVECTGQ